MIDNRLYDIRWFDSNKDGKLIVRKYQGRIQQTDDCFIILYRHKIKCLRKSDCLACVWEDNQWKTA